MFDNPVLFQKYGRVYEEDEIVFCEYECRNELYFIVSGKVRVSKITKHSEKVIVYLGEGEFIGEMAVFENKPRTATIITEEETRMLVFKKEDFYQLMKVAPNLVVELIKVLSKRYIKTERQLNALIEDDLEKKVFNYIFEEYLREKQKGNLKRLNIKLEEIMSVMEIKRDVLQEKFVSFQKKGYLKLTAENIVITEFGWIERKSRERM